MNVLHLPLDRNFLCRLHINCPIIKEEYSNDTLFYYILIQKTETLTSGKEHLGLWLGIITHDGDTVTHCIIIDNNQVIYRSTVCPATTYAMSDHRMNPHY